MERKTGTSEQIVLIFISISKTKKSLKAMLPGIFYFKSYPTTTWLLPKKYPFLPGSYSVGFFYFPLLFLQDIGNEL